MLNVNDKIYLHIGQLEKSINNSNFNKSRLCKILDIKRAQAANGEQVGIYTLQSIHDKDRVYTVMSNDKLWKMSSVNDLKDVIKESKYDTKTIAEIIDLIDNS